MARFSQCPGEIPHPQGEDRIGHLFTVDRDEKNLHGGLRSNAIWKIKNQNMMVSQKSPDWLP
jgi:hypothetical protein